MELCRSTDGQLALHFDASQIWVELAGTRALLSDDDGMVLASKVLAVIGSRRNVDISYLGAAFTLVHNARPEWG